MKFWQVAVMGVWLAANSVFAGETPLKAGEGIDPPAGGFATVAELFRWAAKSSFGGGAVSTCQVGDQDVHVVTRSFTSGRASTELSLYIPNPEGKGLKCVLHLPQRAVERRTRVEEESLVLEQYDYRKGTWVVVMTAGKQFFAP